ncbi:MAG: DoxX family protein [Bdellovibrionota bacterium]
MGFFSRVDSKVQSLSFILDPVLKLIPRLFIATVFIPAGWGKLQNLGKTIEYFKSLNIPLATIQAPLAAFSEVIFGIFVLVGFFTRLSCIPLFCIMVVAVLTAHKEDVTSIYALSELSPALYAVIILCVFTLGSGAFSLDQILFRKK